MKALRDVIDFISDQQGKCSLITVPLPFVRLMGSPEGGIFLAQLLSWSEEGNHEWIMRSYGDWEAATSLSRYRVRALARNCRERGFLEVRTAAGAGGFVQQYRLLRAPLLRRLATHLRGESEPEPIRRRRSARRSVRLPAHADPANLPASPPLKPARARANTSAHVSSNLQSDQLEPQNGSCSGLAAASNTQSKAFSAEQWQAALQELARQMPKPLFDRWLRESRFARVEGEKVIVRVSSVNAAWWLNTRLSHAVTRAVNLVAPGDNWLTVEAQTSTDFVPASATSSA